MFELTEHALAYDEKCALYALIIASIEEQVRAGDFSQKDLAELRRRLASEVEVRGAMRYYWIECGQSDFPEIVAPALR
jgi:hypothetical protein